MLIQDRLRRVGLGVLATSLESSHIPGFLIPCTIWGGGLTCHVSWGNGGPGFLEATRITRIQWFFQQGSAARKRQWGYQTCPWSCPGESDEGSIWIILDPSGECFNTGETMKRYHKNSIYMFQHRGNNGNMDNHKISYPPRIRPLASEQHLHASGATWSSLQKPKDCLSEKTSFMMKPSTPRNLNKQCRAWWLNHS